jgi:hypothetical protein
MEPDNQSFVVFGDEFEAMEIGSPKSVSQEKVAEGREERVIQMIEKRGEDDLVRPERFELPTCCSGGNRSIQLSYGRTLSNSLHASGRSIKPMKNAERGRSALVRRHA